MSGFAGIINLDGAPVERQLLEQIAQHLAFRGPDHQQIVTIGQAGFAFSLFRATEESAEEHQPFTFDQQRWIVGDVRIDARAELVAKLQAKGRNASIKRPDIELILHAYYVWGESCVEHLLGDFAFVIWDVAQQRVFGARDHMGIKPFFYTIAGSTIAVSNTLDCLRVLPFVSSSPNESAIADYLLFEYNRDKSNTFFADIHKVPPAHKIVCSSSHTRIQSYWTLPIDEPLEYRRLDDYTEQFRELLGQSVRDRCRGAGVAIFMSGGLDSPTLAALSPNPPDLCAFTYVFDGYDQERHHAGVVAKHLGMKMVVREGFAEGVDPDWESRLIRTPEPPANPMLLERDWAFFKQVSSSHRVILCGEGPDAALHYEWRPYLSYLAQHNRWGKLVSDCLVHTVLHRRLPLITTIPRAARERRMESTWTSGYPTWLNPEFETRMKMSARWAEEDITGSLHPIRPGAYRALLRARWQVYFEGYDAAGTGAPLDFRHPYFDIRVLRFLLAVPAVPWCRRKYLIRRAMRGMLPETILKRDKTPLYPDPWTALAQRTGFPSLSPGPGFQKYVNETGVFSGTPGTLSDFRSAIVPRSLNYWLKSAYDFRHNT